MRLAVGAVVALRESGDGYIAAARGRRRRFARRIGDGAAVFAAAPEKEKSRGVFYPYRFDGYLYYLSAFAEPESALVLVAEKGKLRREILFCRGRDASREQWDGERFGPLRARREFGIREAEEISELPKAIKQIAREHKTVWHIPRGGESAAEKQLHSTMAQRSARGGGYAIAELRDASAVLDEMRAVKDKSEIFRMREAARLTCAGHLAAMRARPMTREWHIEAELIAEFKRGGGDCAFLPIVAAGENACTLHYAENNSPVRRGQLVVIDAGCEWRGYAADVSRTFPVSGVFSPAQRAVYEVVLAAQKRAIAAIKPGARMSAMENAALRALCEGLRKLGLCSGTVADIIARKSYRCFYPHRAGHFLGLDVHDVGAEKLPGENKARRLRAGMVVTAEPGLYIPGDSDIPKELRRIGIRIEDDVLVTARGREVLTDAAPKSAAAVEKWMRG